MICLWARDNGINFYCLQYWFRWWFDELTVTHETFQFDEKYLSKILYVVGTSIGKRYARTNELGVPLAIAVDSTTSVTLRERDSKQQIRVSIEEVASVVKEVTDGLNTWNDVLWKYPTHSSAASED